MGLSLENGMFIYGSKSDVKNILNQAEIGVLTSRSAITCILLNTASVHMPVVVTDVETLLLLRASGKRNEENLKRYCRKLFLQCPSGMYRK
jgi:ABC-type sulfate transport system permease subunit